MTREPNADDTLPQRDAVTSPTEAHHVAPALRAAGYHLGDVIGRGGMGEVLVARDQRIGRDVAIKRMLTSDPSDEAVARFLREAKIQARLDHPSIVPVHELGYDADGRPYFTMKRLAGVTLDRTLADPDVAPRRLLRAFIDVCLAVELAHSKGVVHRDLKPSNVMLGDFGEVYVLDWGVARVLASSDELVDVAAVPTFDGATEAGALLGTPGYMAPEQIRGENIGPAADIYALGSMLFEILTRAPLHPRGAAALSTTLDPEAISPARRHPTRGIAPELDAACTAALATVPDERPSARALADRIQRYLDGDRDLERRRELAVALVAQAKTALAADDRSAAMHAGGRALALDPESREAAALVTTLMLEPPVVPPPALRAAIAASDGDVIRRHARRAMIAQLAIVSMFPAVLALGGHGLGVVGAFAAVALVMALVADQIARRPACGLAMMTAYAAGSGIMIALLGRLTGPFIMVPAFAAVLASTLMGYPILARRVWLVLVIELAAWLVPPVLEQLDVLSKTWMATRSQIVSLSHAVELGNGASVVMLFVGSFGVIVAAAMLSSASSRAQLVARHALVTQAWQLRQLLPPA